MDRTNLQILQALQKNGRLSMSDLARLVGRAESTVRERIVEMEAKGVLQGYWGRVNPSRIGYNVQAYVKADVDPKEIDALTKRLEAIGNVTRVLLTTGPLPLRIELWAESLQAMEEIIKERIALAGAHNLQTIIVLRTLIGERPLPIPARAGPAGAQGVTPAGSATGNDGALPLLLAGRKLRPKGRASLGEPRATEVAAASWGPPE